MSEITFHEKDGQVDALSFPCRKGKYDRCEIGVTTGEATHPRWHWNGSREKPTLTPSLGCDSRCGWHGHLTDGVLQP